MAEYLLKGGKMLEKSCRTCGCPLFEVKGKTLCVVCAENELPGKDTRNVKETKKAAAPGEQAAAATHEHGDEGTCTCGDDHGGEPCTCDDGGLAEELAFTIHSLCERIQNEKDASHILTLMNAVKAGTEALEILCRL
jgi:UPF0148 protein